MVALMNFGYARVSRTENDGSNLETQIEQLTRHDIRSRLIFSDIASGGSFENRPGWTELMENVGSGDVIVITHLDRLSRNVLGGLQMIERLSERGVGISSLTEQIHTGDDNPSGKLHLHVMLAFAQWYRDTTALRSRQGVARARAAGRHPGRPVKLSPHQREMVRTEHREGKSKTQLSRDYQVSRTAIDNALTELAT